MSDRQIFSSTMAELSGDAHMTNECEKFGMTWGCRRDCPVFEREECEIQEEVEKSFNQTDIE